MSWILCEVMINMFCYVCVCIVWVWVVLGLLVVEDDGIGV